MIDYSKMSDFEINKAVAEKLYKDKPSLIVQRDVPSRPAVTVFCDIGDGEIVSILCADYCNNPADAWPIVVEHGISLYHYYGNWQAEMTYDAPVGAFGTDETCSKFVDDKKPLRAAMIVFLMMKDAEK
ncbi:DUF2591 domain-containing protein [Serratia ureilytica]|uniref:phage protein NinX family protein n=1 Tax=Serratia ureilytica TaxID=300181 RepID=UPI002576E995|nr:phage protein NinX family protein [Serratia ureilytica]MDM1814931.1 DUF2591 domain-containing protein [Serratia ureilytica]